MNKDIAFSIITILLSLNVYSQKLSRFSIEANYGLNGNFFVRSYDEVGGPFNKTYLYKKKFLGTIGGLDIKYALNKRSSIAIAYSRSINKGTKNFNGFVDNVQIIVEDFQLRHINNFYQACYERDFFKESPSFKYHVGIVYARMNQQEIMIENWDNRVVIQERNFKNSYLEEAGIFAGFQYSKKIDTKFELGIKVRGYYLISANTFEAITLTPTLSYRF